MSAANERLEIANGHPCEAFRAQGELTEADWRSVRDALRGLRYGTVNIIVQDGVIVQIERTDRRRLRRRD